MPILGTGSIEKSMDLLDEIMSVLNNARGILGSDQRIISYKEMNNRLLLLRNTLPDAMDKANAILRDEDHIRRNAKKEADEIVSKARNEADETLRNSKERLASLQVQIGQAEQRIKQCKAEADAVTQQAIANANAEVEAYKAQSRAEADMLINDARARSQMLLNQANAEAQRLMSHEQIYMRASVEAERLRNDVAEETAELRRKTIDYIDSQLLNLSELISSMMADINTNREGVNSMR